jgi:hypothetical protein
MRVSSSSARSSISRGSISSERLLRVLVAFVVFGQ